MDGCRLGPAFDLLLPDAGTARRESQRAREHQLRIRNERCRRAEFHAGSAVVRDAAGRLAGDYLLPDASPAAALRRTGAGSIRAGVGSIGATRHASSWAGEYLNSPLS